VTVTPAANQSGTTIITVTVTDADGGTRSDTFLLTVNAVNDAPTISDVANQSTPAGTAAGPLAMTVGDIDTAATSLTMTGGSSNTTLVPLANIVFGGSGTARTATITPAAGQSGTATITLTVSDGTLTASDTFVLTVTAVAKTATTTSTPTSSLNPSTYGQAVTFSTTVTGAGGPPTGTVTFYDVTAANSPITLGTATLNASGVGSLTTTAVVGGTRSITASYGGDTKFAASTSAAFTQTVNKGTATGTFLTLTPSPRQYSDRVLMEVTVPTAVAGTVNFQIGTQVLAANVPIVNGKASANPQLLGTALGGSKIVTAVFNSPSHTVANVTRSIAISKEDARATYSGPTTLCLCGQATVPITVTVSDITAIDPVADPDAGDISQATIAFVNRTTGATLANPVVVANLDRKTGTATYNFPASALGTATSTTITVGFVVGGSYNRNNIAENATISITK
jgi:Bacterial Ig-like domain (group 3)/Bacterial Ig domain